jgi:MobA/MobL family
VRLFVASAFIGPGMVADIAIHAPGRRRAEKRNHHAHVLLTMRAIEGDGFGVVLSPIGAPPPVPQPPRPGDDAEEAAED